MDARLLDLWLRNMSRRDSTLSPAEVEVMAGAITEVVYLPSDRDIVSEGQRSQQSNLIIEGWACRYINLADGRRQIVAFHLPGDFVDLHSFPLKIMDHSVATLTPCRVALAPHERLKRITETEPHLTRLLWTSTMIDAAMHRHWLLGAGQRSSLEHAAHIFCELFTRLEITGQAEAGRFVLPITQAELADAMGITSVHVNRVVSDLKTRGFISWRGSQAEILDWGGLASLAEWDSTYLNIEDFPR